MHVPLSELFPESSLNKGITGLKNLGNTCFMNSIIQCLVNTEPILRYFLFDIYQLHLNTQNTYGLHGKLAVAFSELVKQLFASKFAAVNPWKIKALIGYKNNQFEDFSQQDSQEMLSVLLENLHEDVNQIAFKPYIQYQDSQDRKDEEVAAEFWEIFKQREQSLFVDIFYGQLKSRVSCTKCDNANVSFDSFNILSIPIPGQSGQKFFIKFVPYNFEQNSLNLHVAVGDILEISKLRCKV